jgi:hypothetical protein
MWDIFTTKYLPIDIQILNILHAREARLVMVTIDYWSVNPSLTTQHTRRPYKYNQFSVMVAAAAILDFMYKKGFFILQILKRLSTIEIYLDVLECI